MSLGSSITREIHIVNLAWSYFTRFPPPLQIRYSDDLLNATIRYLPWIGLVLGLLGIGLFWLASLWFPHQVAAILMLGAFILFTGAFHEDGFADFCDGFGGGWTKEDILRIMKDSRIGTFGTLGLIYLHGIKLVTLLHIDPALFGFAFVSGQVVSRFSMIPILNRLRYGGDVEHAKAKPVASSRGASLPSLLFGVVPLVGCYHYFDNNDWLLTLLPLVLLFSWLVRYMRKWIGGYTGDCLGASQQLFEVVYYLAFLAVLS